MTLVILAAGMGSRYGGLKQVDAMTEKGEAILDFSVFDAKRAGFDRVCFIIKKEIEEEFKEKVGNKIAEHIEVVYAYQALDKLPDWFTLPEDRVKPWGTAHALLCAKNEIGNDLMIVLNADDFYGKETFSVLADFLKTARSGEFAMAGYILKNTLTENGSVSRGICITDENGYLTEINERTKIYKKADETTVYQENGKEILVDENSIVSMNCWAFTSDIFDLAEEYFEKFLKAPTDDPLKREFYLPFCVNEAMHDGKCTVKVLPVSAKWYGVTYPEDKPKVVASIRALIEAGEYPNGLFK